MTIKLIAAISATFFGFSCQQKIPACGITKEQLLNTEEKLVFAVGEDTGNTFEYRDKGTDSIKGGYYTFLPRRVSAKIMCLG